MEFLKQWCFCVCVTLVCAVFFSLFAPNGRMKSFYKILISFFIFVSFLYPLQNFRLSDINVPELSDAVDESGGAGVYETAVNNQIKALLEDNGIDAASVSCTCTVDYNTLDISVSDVVVAVGDGIDKKAVEKMIFDSLGLTVRVIGLGD